MTKGLTISKAYFEQYGLPMLQAEFPHWADRVAVGLMGSGSECFGFDDEISRDHDFEAGFCLFIPGEDIMDRQTAFKLERAYAKLPGEFMGVIKSSLSPVGGSRHGVIRTGDFLKEKLGREDPALLTPFDWLSLPESSLFELSKGSLFYDPSGLLAPALEQIRHYPEDIRQKKLAGELLMMAQAGQYNYIRCIKRGDEGAAALCCHEFVRAALHSIFLLNRSYMPYYKWQFRALKDLPLFSELADPLSFLISSPNGPTDAEEKYSLIEDLAGVFIAELLDQGLTEASCGDLEKHAYSVNDQIENGQVRNLHILAAL